MKYVGVDIGGTNLKAGLTDESGQLLAVQKMKVASITDQQSLAWTIVSLTQELGKCAGVPLDEIASVGVGVPGTVEIRSGSIGYTCNLPLRNVPLRKLFHHYLSIPLYIENDANCAALAEYYAGAGRESKRFVTITLGTGVGAGIIHNGKVYHGANGMAGEVGHTVIVKDGLPCPCGRHGCWEQYASATALKRMTTEALAAHPDSILARVVAENDGHVSGQSAFIAARQGDPVGQKVCDDYVSGRASPVERTGAPASSRRSWATRRASSVRRCWGRTSGYKGRAGGFMSWYEELDRWTADYLPDMTYEHDVPLARHTSFRIGGPARRMAFPKDGSQMVLLIGEARACGAAPLVIGNGTNLLFPDEGVERLVVNTRDMSGMALDAAGRVTAEAGASLARTAVFAQQHGLTGLEFAHGIPGSVGGAVCMNAGAYGGEMRQVVHSAVVLFPEEGIRTLTGEELAFSYRHSLLTDRPDAVVLRAVFALEAGEPAAIRGKMDDLMARRKASQPLEYPSAGSTFKRPEGYYAAALIDQCGLKGLTVGGAQVSEKHAGFVINRGGATCADVTALMAEIQKRVWEKTGVRLEPEVRVIH